MILGLHVFAGDLDGGNKAVLACNEGGIIIIMRYYA